MKMWHWGRDTNPTIILLFHQHSVCMLKLRRLIKVLIQV